MWLVGVTSACCQYEQSLCRALNDVISGHCVFKPWIIHTNVDWNRFRDLCVMEFQSLLSAYTEFIQVINHGGTCRKCRRFRGSF